MSKIEESLANLLQKHRIILWYDEEQSFREEYASLTLPGVEKITVENNEFAVKYNLYVKNPGGKFLLYLPHPHPENEENWLLDVELANYLFHTDREAMILQELELPITYRSWIRPHLEFFRSKEREQKFNLIKGVDDTEHRLTMKMIQNVLGASSPGIEELITQYALLFIQDKSDEVDRELARFGLDEPFWNEVELNYGYKSANRGIYDFLLELFQKGFKPIADKAGVNKNAEVLLSRWKDLRSFEDAFKLISARIEKDLNIADTISELPLEEIVSEDLFEGVDKQVIRELVFLILNESQNPEKIKQILKSRENTFWWGRYSAFYKALENALLLTDAVNRYKELSIEDYNNGFRKYTTEWYLVDQYYRLFIQYYREVNQNAVLSELFERVHKIYSNTWLPKLGHKWQEVIDKSGRWYDGSMQQSRFFQRDVKSRYLDKSVRLFVIISDGLRYECGKELHDLINGEARYTSSLEYQVTGLPSYTQLGMAAMLPHKELSLGEGESILADGVSTIGLQGRQKILQMNAGVSAAAITAEDLMRMPSKGAEAQELIQGHNLIYVYHNRIDKLGDDKTTEDKVIEASREEIAFLMEVVKKIGNMNGTHVVITSDHGFIYQHEELAESDFTDAQIEGTIYRDSRRYVIGENLTHNQNVMKFNARDLNIHSDREILLPKGIIRLRKQGSGSRYVHGGMSLQETVVPLLFVARKKMDTVSKVEIDIINKTSNRITTNIHTVKFYQKDPVGSKYTARTIKSYFAIIEGEEQERKVISDVFNYTFDLTKERSEEREVPYRFTLSTNIRNSDNVYLFIEEKVEKSDKWITLSKFNYRLSLVMKNDFDDF
jgi:uncharacterized protein (TIGR02687 family)